MPRETDPAALAVGAVYAVTLPQGSLKRATTTAVAVAVGVATLGEGIAAGVITVDAVGDVATLPPQEASSRTSGIRESALVFMSELSLTQQPTA